MLPVTTENADTVLNWQGILYVEHSKQDTVHTSLARSYWLQEN